MAQTTKQLLGQFLNQRYKNLDTVSNPFEPFSESFVNLNLPEVQLQINPSKPPAGPVIIGDFKRLGPSPMQPSLGITLSKPPADAYRIGDLTRLGIAAAQPSLPTTLSKPPADAYRIGDLTRLGVGPRDNSEEAALAILGDPPLGTAPLDDSLVASLARSGVPLSNEPAARTPPPYNPRNVHGSSPPASANTPGEVLVGIKQSTRTSLREVEHPDSLVLASQAPPNYKIPDETSKSVGKNIGEAEQRLRAERRGETQEKVPKIIAQLIGSANHGDILNDLGYRDPKSTDSGLNPFGKHPTTLARGPDPHGGISIKKRLQEVDKELFRFLKNVGGDSGSIETGFGNPDGHSYAPLVSAQFGMQGGQSWNPILFAKNVVRLGVHMGTLGLITFAATQVGLALLNKTQEVGPRISIWNPLTLANPPLLQNFVPHLINQLPLVANFTHENQVDKEKKDRHKAIAQGTHVEPFQVIFPNPPFFIPNQPIGKILGPVGAVTEFLFPRLVGAKSQENSILEPSLNPLDVGSNLIETAMERRNFYTQEFPLSEKAVFRISDLVDEVLDGKKDLLVEDKENSTAKDPKVKWGDAQSVFMNSGLGKLFASPDIKLSNEWRPLSDVTLKRGKSLIGGDLERWAFTKGIIPVRFRSDNKQGFITSLKNISPSKVITDDEAYMPLSFTDLRPVFGDSLRTVYFRPFITDFREEFHPDWNKAHYLGRTDWVATYQSTGRSISLAFQLHSFGPEDVDDMYAKLNWLVSMVYPKYDSNLSYVSGPVVRLRIGDVISSRPGHGLPGIIEGLSFDYGGALWELKKDRKVPRGIKVSMTFVVLHDLPIGIGGNGKFGGIGKISAGELGVDGKPTVKGSYIKQTKTITADKVEYPEILTESAEGFRGVPAKLNNYETT